ncbi:MAG TPA: hypothetical protein VIL37_09655 [Natronosporangium sp.]
MIVRLFEPAPGTGRVDWRGLVEDVRTGVTWQFDGGDQLLRAIAAAANGEAVRTGEGTSEQTRWS